MPGNLIQELGLLLSRAQQPTEHEVRVALLRWVTDFRPGAQRGGADLVEHAGAFESAARIYDSRDERILGRREN
jgi:hypothetical protein